MRVRRTWKNAASIVFVQPIRIPLLIVLHLIDVSFDKLSWAANWCWAFVYDHMPAIEMEKTAADIAREEAKRKELIARILRSAPAERGGE